MPLFQPRLNPREDTSIATFISMTYFDVYAWIMFIHMQTCLLRDLILSGNSELLFRSHNAIDLRGQERIRTFRPARDI